MFVRIAFLVAAAVLFAFPAFAAGACGPWYSGDQCLQMRDDQDEDPEDGGSCGFQMCGNAIGRYQSDVEWCEASGTWVNCPIYYCEHRPCAGSNCTPVSQTCNGCSTLAGNTVEVTGCPW